MFSTETYLTFIFYETVYNGKIYLNDDDEFKSNAFDASRNCDYRTFYRSVKFDDLNDDQKLAIQYYCCKTIDFYKTNGKSEDESLENIGSGFSMGNYSESGSNVNLSDKQMMRNMDSDSVTGRKYLQSAGLTSKKTTNMKPTYLNTF